MKVNIFKKIKLLSAFDLILISTVVGLLVFFFLFFFRKTEYADIRLKVTDIDVLYANTSPNTWYANNFRTGDVELDTLGRKISEITNVESFNVDADRKAVYLDMRVRATYDSKTHVYTAKGKPLIFGTPIRFNLSGIVFDGIVTEFPRAENTPDYKEGWVTVETLGRSVEPAVAESVKKGDKIFDSKNNVLAQLDGVTISRAEKVTVNLNGDPLLRLDPLYKDMKLVIKMKAKLWRGEIFAFDDYPIKVGKVIPLNFEDISLLPVVTRIVEQEF